MKYSDINQSLKCELRKHCTLNPSSQMQDTYINVLFLWKKSFILVCWHTFFKDISILENNSKSDSEVLSTTAS